MAVENADVPLIARGQASMGGREHYGQVPARLPALCRAACRPSCSALHDLAAAHPGLEACRLGDSWTRASCRIMRPMPSFARAEPRGQQRAHRAATRPRGCLLAHRSLDHAV